MDTDFATRSSSQPSTTPVHPRPILVILDRGDVAWPAEVRLDEPPAAGLRFWHGGRQWRIARERTAWRTFVAEPIGA